MKINKYLNKWLPFFNLTGTIFVKINNSKKYQGLYQEIDPPSIPLDKDGFAIPNSKAHQLTFSRRYKHDLEATVIHELVHALQNELNLKVNHKKFFKQLKKYFKEYHNVTI